MSHAQASSGQVIDLTKMVAKSYELGATDVALIAVSGGLGFLAKKAFQHFYPGVPSISEQIENMIKLMDAGRRSGAKRMVFKMTNSADIFPTLGDNRFSVRVQNAVTIEFEVEFV